MKFKHRNCEKDPVEASWFSENNVGVKKINPLMYCYFFFDLFHCFRDFFYNLFIW